MFRGKFFTGEKLREYRDYCHVQGLFAGAGVASLGFGIGSGADGAFLAAGFFFGVTLLNAYWDGEFEKIEDTIEDADRGESFQ